MAKQKEFTVAEWDLLEARKRDRLREAELEFDARQARRSEAVIRAELGDKAAEAELQNDDLALASLKKEIESIQELLKVIPARKNYAKSFEVEKKAEALRGLDGKFPELAARIDAAAEAYVLAVKDYLDVMKSGLAHGMDMRRYQIGANEGLAFYIKQYGLDGWLKRFQKGRTIVDYVNGTGGTAKCYMRQDIDSRIEKMMDHVRHLRGEIEGDLNYCPECYSGLVYSRDKMVCKSGCISE